MKKLKDMKLQILLPESWLTTTGKQPTKEQLTKRMLEYKAVLSGPNIPSAAMYNNILKVIEFLISQGKMNYNILDYKPTKQSYFDGILQKRLGQRKLFERQTTTRSTDPDFVRSQKN